MRCFGLNREEGDAFRAADELFREALGASQRSEPEAATDLARAALAHEPHHVGALELLAKELWKLARLPQILPVLDQLVLLNPYEPGYHALRGSTLQALARFGEASAAYERWSALAEGAERAEAERLVGELDEWQRALIADLVREDPVFRATYAHDPVAACSSRGLRLPHPHGIHERQERPRPI